MNICRYQQFGFKCSPQNHQKGCFVTFCNDDSLEKGLFDFRWLCKDPLFLLKKYFAENFEVFVSRNFSFDFKNPIKC